MLSSDFEVRHHVRKTWKATGGESSIVQLNRGACRREGKQSQNGKPRLYREFSSKDIHSLPCKGKRPRPLGLCQSVTPPFDLTAKRCLGYVANRG